MVSGPTNVTVGTTATKAVNYSPLRTNLAITNTSSADIYYGNDSSVTTSNGFPIRAGATAIFSDRNGDDPRLARYLISGSAAQNVRIAEEYAKGEINGGK